MIFDSLLIIGAKKFLTPYLVKYFSEDYPLVSPKKIFAERLPEDFTGTAVAVVCDMNKLTKDTPIKGVCYAIGLSSTSIYDAEEGLNFNEETPLDDSTETFLAEQHFASHFAETPSVILRLPEMVIGTEMDNLGIKIAHQIFRGSYLHIKDKDGHCSAVHATAVAEAAVKCAQKDITGIYNFNDGINHSVTDIAEALAHRLGDRRIFTTSNGKARFCRFIGDVFGIEGWNSKMYRFKTQDLTFSAERLLSAMDYRPTPVTEYLKKHVYDENSL